MNSQETAVSAPDPRIVAGINSGKRFDPLEIVFTTEQNTAEEPVPETFKITPATAGTVDWKDEHTLRFTPHEPFTAGEQYHVNVHIPSLEPFGFSFEIPFSHISVSFNPVYVTDSNESTVSGTISAERDAIPDHVEQILAASPLLGKPTWEHSGTVHRFAYAPLKPGAHARTVTIDWSGLPVGTSDRGTETIRIPGTELFEILAINPVDSASLEIVFSAPLKKNQDLRGFIALSTQDTVRYTIDNNIVTVFGSQNGERVNIPVGSALTIQEVPDAQGRILAESREYVVTETWELPEVRFPGTGVILPTSQDTVVLIETRNLTGLLIEAFRMYGDNMIQFLQINDLDGDSEFNRVGEPVWTKELSLPWKAEDKNKFVRHGIDLSALNQNYPDSLFHIRITFRPRHIQYVCGVNHADFSHLTFPEDDFPAFYRYGESSYANSTWSWAYRDDPCHPAYYAYNTEKHNVRAGQNILISDLGLLAKKNKDGSLFVAASHLKTTEPLSDATVTVRNYQGKLLAQTQVSPDGIANFADSAAIETAYFVIAESKSAGKNYLNIDDSHALATSHFEVGGGLPLNTTRGLIYGERGVWRPGDTMFLTFLLADPEQTLPVRHPLNFSLEDPLGRTVESHTFSGSVDGFYPFIVTTRPDAPTGNWTARVKVGGASYQKTLKVETVIPNRLGITLDFGNEERISAHPTPVTFKSSWLFGAPASQLKADINVSFSSRTTAFPAYGNYLFQSSDKQFPETSRQTVFEGTLNNEGIASFNMSLEPNYPASGKLTAHFFTRVFEQSGAFSSEQVNYEFSPYDRYVGIRFPTIDRWGQLDINSEHTVDIVVVNPDGKAVPTDVALTCTVYKLDWRWWWEMDSQEAADFVSQENRMPAVEGTTIARNGKAAYSFRIDSQAWGPYLVIVQDVAGGHSVAQNVYIGWGDRPQGQTGETVLNLGTEKPLYAVGETVAVTFPSNAQARALITVEKGGSIIRREWIQCSDTSSRYTFVSDESMVPNVYVHVSLIQPHLQTKNDLPIRLYGIIPITIENEATRIQPHIDTAPQWQSESKASFTVYEANAKPMTYTVAVVDEGLLGLTRYTVPDPHSTFYAKEASFIKSFDLYAHVIGAYTGKLESLLAIGGSEDSAVDTSIATQRWKPIVRFFGPFKLEAGEKRTEEFELEPYVGSVRIMVLAASPQQQQRAYGKAEQSVIVSSDLMAFATVPRVLSPGDSADIPVSIFSYHDGNRQIKLTATVDGATVLGEQIQQISAPKHGEYTVLYRIKAPAAPGVISFSVKAESPGLKTAHYTVPVTVRSTAIPITVAESHLITAHSTWNGTLTAPGAVGTNNVTVELSQLPSIDLSRHTNYLITYPHGCIEQVTSAVFPQLYLDRFIKLSATQLTETRAYIVAAIESIKNFQTSDGGFSYWPGGREAHNWGTSYAGHFLIEARRAGYQVPADLVEQWIKFQKNTASNWNANFANPRSTIDSAYRNYTLLDQAYRLYTLALAGSADIGSMNRLRERNDVDSTSKWRLATAYWLIGQRDIARSMIKDLDITVADYRELSDTFGSTVRDKALILETLAITGQLARAQPLIESIAQSLSSGDWLSTQDIAYALMALSSVAKPSNSPLTVICTVGNATETVTFSTQIAHYAGGSQTEQSIPFSFQNTSAIPVYVRIIANGIPEEGLEPALREGLSITVDYRTMDGVRVNPFTVARGSDMQVTVTVTNASRIRELQNIALIHPLPAGWEIINTRLGTDDKLNNSIQYQDIRDDRIMSYFDLNRAESKQVQFVVNNAYSGTFYLPAIHAYAMYDESIRALVPGAKRATLE
ncbi:MAG: alpha-2-macroglobulin [Treponema sp.]|nr:alpha-2-macroglobulin [Treponema sp.]